MPIFVRYQRILDLENKLKPEMWTKYKDELFGTDTEVFAPERYNEFDIVQRLRIDPRRWMTVYELDIKAQLIAKVQLSTVVDIVRRHDQLQKEKEKKRQDEANRKQQAAAPKRGGKRR